MNTRRAHETQWSYEERLRQRKAMWVALIYMLAFFGIIGLSVAAYWVITGGF